MSQQTLVAPALDVADQFNIEAIIEPLVQQAAPLLVNATQEQIEIILREVCADSFHEAMYRFERFIKAFSLLPSNPEYPKEYTGRYES